MWPVFSQVRILSLTPGEKMRAVVYERDFDTHTWCTKGECEVIEQTDRSIKVKEGFFKKAKWYPKRSMGIRFDIIPE